MRKFLGIVMLILGIPVLLAGAAAAVYVGPDDTFDVGDERVESDAAAIVTSPSFLEFAGPALHVTADSGDAEIFVGVAHPVHIEAYLTDVAHVEVVDVTVRRDLTILEREGAEAPAAEPGGLDWWADSTVGTGEQSVSYELTDEPAQIVVMNSDTSTPLDVELGVGAEVDGLFATLLILVAASLLPVVGGVLLLRSARRRKRGAGKRARRKPSSTPDDDTSSSEEAPPATTRTRTPVTGFDQLRRGAIAAVGALALGACADVPEQVDRSDDQPVPAATTAQVEDFFIKYTKVNNVANADFDAEKLGAVEEGTLLNTSTFSYTEAEAQGDDPIEPFTISASSTARPALDAYPMWYLASDTWDGETEGSTQYLVERADATGPWKATLSVSVPGGIDLPAPTVTDGAARVVDDSEATAATEVFDKLVAFAEGGKKPEGINVENAEGVSGVRNLGIVIEDFSKDMGTVDISCAVDNPEAIRWLATDDGLMAMGSLSCTQSIQLKEGLWFQMDDPYGTIPTGVNLNSTTANASVSFIIGVNDDGTATMVDDGAALTGTEHTKYKGDTE